MIADWMQKLSVAEMSGAASRWEHMLEALPGASPVGSEATHLDVFLEVKEQFSRLSGLDVSQVVADCSALLTTSSKDLRLAVFLTYGWLRQDGYAGLARGLELTALLLYRFGDDLWPVRADARKTTLEWLCGQRVMDWLATISSSGGPERYRAVEPLTWVIQYCGGWPDHARPNLQPLLKYLSDDNRSAEPVATAEIPARMSASAGARAEIHSSQALMEGLRAMAAYLRQQPHGAFCAYRLVRCVRWDSVPASPPHDGHGLTRLAGPRQELRRQLKRLWLQKQWHALLEAIEPAFLEGANHFWLDLQYYAWEAMFHLGDDYRHWRDHALTDLAQLRDRLVGVEQLRFCDGSGFAADLTLEWLASHARMMDVEAGESIATPPVMAGRTLDEQTLQTEAMALADAQGLAHALAWMQSLPQSAGAREDTCRQVLMARLAEASHRPDIALHLIAGLDDRLSRETVFAWEPGLVFDIKTNHLRLLRQSRHGKGVDKDRLQLRIHHLRAELSRLDPVRAVLLPVD